MPVGRTCGSPTSKYRRVAYERKAKLIEDYIAAQPDIELVSERVDDGYSGVLFAGVR